MGVQALETADTAMEIERPQSDEYCDIATNLRAVAEGIAAAAAAVGRDPGEVTLVAVAKLQPAEKLMAALAAGHRVFGENRVQEAKARWPALKERFPDVVLHMVGPVQSNKVRDAVALFDVIETVDRPKLARALAAEMERSGRRPECLIQVNTGAEPQKAGVRPEEAGALIDACRADLGLPITGLMCIPPMDEEPSLHFALLARIARRHGLEKLSMGMTADYEIAVRFGATMVRVGTAIFGPRPERPRET
jgi:pyridoxal phosphate enzyme (YggS family)